MSLSESDFDIAVYLVKSMRLLRVEGLPVGGICALSVKGRPVNLPFVNVAPDPYGKISNGQSKSIT